jgi:hypothetical protein
MINTKKYVVWYKGGSGGFFVSWLLQTAIDPTLLDCALDVFPVSLGNDHKLWRSYERTPIDVGLLCNVFHPNTYYSIDLESETRRVFESIISGNNDNFDTLLNCRVKFYLTNYVYHAGHVTSQKLSEVTQHPEKYHLHDIDYIKQITDILLDASKNIFIKAPERYLELASQTKNCRYSRTPINELIAEYPVKYFSLETVWQGGWEHEVSKILGTPLSPDAILAGSKLVDRYLEIMPQPLKEFCNVN